MTVQAAATAKIILTGEHAVVYGKPAIAVPVTGIHVTASAFAAQNGRLEIIAHDIGERFTFVPSPCPDVENPLYAAVCYTLAHIGKPPPPVTIHIRSTIPVASGLGSGAAVSAALARVLALVTDHPLGNDQLNSIVYEVEKLHHGTPSGIDNAVIVYESPIYFVRNQPPTPLQPGAPFHFLIADTGRPARTRVTVSDVRRLYEADAGQIQPILDEIGDIAAAARQAIQNGDITQLGQLLSSNHELLQKLTVSSPELDRLVDAAVQVGAAGAKMSGGGRGGNMIALVTPATHDRVRTALEQAGAARIFETTLSPTTTEDQP